MDRRGRSGGEEGSGVKKEKKSDGTCSFIRPFTPVATATCLEGTPERRRRWQKNNRAGRELVRAAQAGRQAQPNQTASIRPGLQHQEEEQEEQEEEQEEKRKVTDQQPASPRLSSTHAGQGRTFRAFFCLRRVMNTHSSAEGLGLSGINTGFDPAEVRPTDQV